MQRVARVFAAIALTASAVVAADPGLAPRWPELGVETSIIYPDRSIRNFEVDEDRGVWIEDRQHRWYYARLDGPCHGMRFARGLGFDTRGSVRLDRHSRIVTEDDICPIESLVTSEGPPATEEAGNQAPATTQQEAPDQ